MIVQGGAPPEARITYQGVQCAQGVFSAPYGIGAGTGHVVMPQKAWPRSIIGDPWQPHGAGEGTNVSTTIRGESPTAEVAPLDSSLKIRGPLVFAHGWRSITLPNIYLSDAGVEDARRSDESIDRGLIRVPLVTVVYLWSTRGDICGRYNILKSSSGLRGRFGQVAKTRQRSGTLDQGEDFEPDTIRPGGKPYTLLDLVKLCLSRLPGVLVLVANAETAAADAIIPTGLDYSDSPFAGKVLGALLKAWNFRFVYDPIKDRAEIWRFDEGRPKAQERGIVARLSFVTATSKVEVAAETITERKRLTQHFLRPKTVRVVGRPVIREAKVALELAGEINGEVVPLDAALAFHGFTRQDAARFVLLPSESQKRWKLGGLRSINSLTVNELRRWAFRMARFRERDFGSGYRPIQPYRARSMVDGSRRKPVIWADYHDEVSFGLWRQEIDAKLVEIQQTAVSDLERLKAVLDPLSTQLLEREISRARLTGADGLASFLVELVSPLFRPRPALANAADEAAARKRMRAIQRDIRAITTLAARRREVIYKTEERETAIANRYGEIVSPSEYRVDDQGNVHFARLVGHIQYLRAEGPDPTSPLATVREQMALISDEEPTIRMLFAYTSTPSSRRAARLQAAEEAVGTDEDAKVSRPGLDKATDNVDHFNYLGGLVGGKPVRLNPDNIEPESSANLFPERVEADLRQYVDIDGATNQSELEAAAASIVLRKLEGDLQAVGERGESATLWPLTPTGAVASVEWEIAPEGRARTRWTVGVERSIELRQQTQIRVAGVGGVEGSARNPNVGGTP